MTKTQWCREHAEQVAQECGLDQEMVLRETKAREFVEQAAPSLSGFSTQAVLTVEKIKDPEVQKKVIETIDEQKTAYEKLRKKKQKPFLMTVPMVKEIVKEIDPENTEIFGKGINKPKISGEKNPFEEYLETLDKVSEEIKMPSGIKTLSEEHKKELIERLNKVIKMTEEVLSKLEKPAVKKTGKK